MVDPDANFHLSVNRRFGDYECQSHLGGGQFGVLLGASNPQTGSDVAVKVLRTRHLGNIDAMREFERESRLLDRLAPAKNVVDMIESDREDIDLGGAQVQFPWIALELADADLESLLVANRSALTWTERLRILRNIALGIHQMHTAGVVHRDLKSSNVLLFGGAGSSVTAKVSDLGRSADLNQPPTPGALYDLPNGDFRFAPPEFLWGLGSRSPVDVMRADIYLLGSVFFELATAEAITTMYIDVGAVRNHIASLDPAQRANDFAQHVPDLQTKIQLPYSVFAAELDPAIREPARRLLASLTAIEPASRRTSARSARALPSTGDLQWILRAIDGLIRALKPRPRLQRGLRRSA